MKRGRPRVAPDQRLIPVTIHLPPHHADALCRLAVQHHVSVAEVVRRQLRLTPDAPPDPPDR